jgi:hypothetical protein
MGLWRIQVDKGGSLFGPMAPEAVALRLLVPNAPLLWVIGDDGTQGFAEDIPEMQATLLDSHLPHIARLWLREPGFGPLWVGSLATRLCERDSIHVLAFIRALVAEARNDEELAFIGAGPVEDLLRKQGPESIDAVEAAAASDARFRFALAGAWPEETHPDVWKRVTVALGDQPRY